MPKKKFDSFNQVNTGADLMRFSRERGAEIHDSRKGVKIRWKGIGSFLTNPSKELSPSDKAHYKRLLKIFGIISVLLAGVTFVAAVAQQIAHAYGYTIVWF